MNPSLTGVREDTTTLCMSSGFYLFVCLFSIVFVFISLIFTFNQGL